MTGFGNTHYYDCPWKLTLLWLSSGIQSNMILLGNTLTYVCLLWLAFGNTFTYDCFCEHTLFWLSLGTHYFMIALGNTLYYNCSWEHTLLWLRIFQIMETTHAIVQKFLWEIFSFASLLHCWKRQVWSIMTVLWNILYCDYLWELTLLWLFLGTHSLMIVLGNTLYYDWLWRHILL